MTACHPDPGRQAGPDDLPVVALVGRPNVGKSTFLARASRRYAETGNAPGTTVTLERRRITAGGRESLLVDLPGTRSLTDQPVADEPFWRLLLDAHPDAILLVIDAGDIGRHLPLVLACRDLGLPIVVAANLADEARAKGVSLDAGRLSQLLLAPVHLTDARSGHNVDAPVADAVARATQRRAVAAGTRSPHATGPAGIYPPALERQVIDETRLVAAGRSLGAAVADADGLVAASVAGVISARGAATLRLATALDPARWDVARRWADQVEGRTDVRPRAADRLARLVTAPFPGIPLFLLVSLGMFATVALFGGALADLLSSAWAAHVSPVLTSVVTAIVPWPAVAGAILWAVDGGLLAMIAVGIPYVLLFYVLLAALEDSGYLVSAAVLVDRVFNGLGLPGRAAIPLMTAAGCNVPAIIGTRILRTRRERLLGAFLVTLTPCSARSAVVIAAVAPFAGPVAALAAFGLVLAIGIGSTAAANALVPGRQPALVMELAPLRMPIARHVGAKAWARFRSFVVTATPIMLIGSLLLGLVYESGLWSPIASTIDPVTHATLGLPAIAVVAIAFAFLRKELALQLLVALAVVEHGAAGGALGSFLTPAQLFVFAIVTCVSIPCASTFATLSGELGRRAAIGLSAATLGLALTAGIVLAHLLGAA
ncbi:MAG: ferrous iron transporter B [Chloroflexota bacterium]